MAGTALAHAAVGHRRRGRLEGAEAPFRGGGLGAYDQDVAESLSDGGAGGKNVDFFDWGRGMGTGDICCGCAEGAA